MDVVRALTIKRLKKDYKVSRIDQLPKDVVPPKPDVVRFINMTLYQNVVDGLELVVQQVDRLFETYSKSHPDVTLEIIVGKWTQDYIEGFFGIARGRKGPHNAVNMNDLRFCLVSMQQKGTYNSVIFLFKIFETNHVHFFPEIQRYKSEETDGKFLTRIHIEDQENSNTTHLSGDVALNI